MNSPKKLKALLRTAAIMLLPAVSLPGQFTYVENFQGSTAEGWIFGSESGSFTPDLTAGGLGIDPVGDGWLRLTTAGGNQSNYAYLDSPVKTVGNEVSITFDYTVHGGSGADGITFFMFDADVAFDAGAFGGSLGYANRDDTTPLSAGDGMAGGYFGLGLDTWGNFSNPTEGRNGGEGFLPDEIVLRGPGDGQTGYDYIAGTGGINTTDGDAPIASLDVDLQFSARPETGTGTEDNYYTVNIFIDPDLLLTVSIDSDLDGTFEELFTADLSGFPVPEELKMGYTASTGGATNIHEIRNLEVVTTSQPVGAEFWDNDLGNSNWDDTSGSVSNWVSDGLPVDWADIFFGDDYNNGNPNAAEFVDIEQDRDVRSISFDNAFDYTVDGNSPNDNFVIGAPNGGNAAINVSEANYTPAGDNTVTHTIEAPITLDDDLTITNITDSADLVLNGNFTTDGNDITVNTTGAGLVTINGTIDDSTDLTKEGAGRLILNGSNTYTGDTDINGGTVEIGAENNLGASPGSYDADKLRFDGGTLNTTATISMSANRGVTLDNGGGALEVDGGTTLTLNSDIVGSGGLTKEGAGTLDLNGDNSDFTGGFTINAGKVTATDGGEITLGVNDNNDNFLGAGAVTLNAGELEVTSTGDTVDLNGAFTQNGGTATFTSEDDAVLIEGSAVIDINGGTFNIDADADVDIEDNSVVTVDGATVNIVAGDDLEFEDNAQITFTNSDINIDAADNFEVQNSSDVTVNSGAIDIEIGGGTGGDEALFQVESSATWVQTGGTTTLDVKTGDGSGNNRADIDGILTVDGVGTVFNVNTDEGLEIDGAVNVINGGELDVENDLFVDSGTLDGGSTATPGEVYVGGDLIVDGANGDIAGNPNITMDGTSDQDVRMAGGSTIDDIGTFTQAGSGTTTIDSSVTSFGANEIVIEAGTLLLGANNQVTNGTDMTLAGGTFATGGFDDTLDTLTLTASSVIDLNGGNSILNFDDSSGNSWIDGETLYITNWNGNFTTGGGNDQIIFGTDGLDATQVSQIIFVNPNGTGDDYNAQILGNGEVVPWMVVPEPSTYFGGGLLIGLAGLHYWRRRRKWEEANG